MNAPADGPAPSARPPAGQRGGSSPISTLALPRTLFAAGSISALRDELSAMGVRRPMLVTDRGLVTAGLATKARTAYGDDASLVIFDEVTENPLFSDVDRAAKLYAQRACDGVIALGGGSVIDTAKLVALLATNAGSISKFAGVPNAPHVATAPLVAIPTTAGTGSEASPSAGIHPTATTASVGMNSRHLVPKIAILDPDLTASLPPRLAAATGIDALSHCIEGFLSERTVPLGKSIALDGIARIARYLRRAVVERGDTSARAEMMMAAYAGGVSIGMGLGPAHAVALTCSDQGFHHGVLSGIGLVATLDVTAEHVPDRVAAAAEAFGIRPSASLGQAVAALMRELGLPATLAELKYSITDVNTLADAAYRSHFNLSAPFHPTASQYFDMISGSMVPS